jgi:hypothetical protein
MTQEPEKTCLSQILTLKTDYQKVCDFNQAFDFPQYDYLQSNDFQNEKCLKLRLALIEEELSELTTAYEKHDYIEEMDACADILYVAYGMAYTYKIDSDEFLNYLIKDNNLSLFQNTVIRANSLADEFFNCERIIIVGNESHRFIILDQLSELNLNVKTQLIIETDSKNTAPALTLASLEVSNENLNEILIAMPADHLIKDQGAFIKSIHLAIRQAYLNEIVTLGVLPRSPNI